MNLYVSNLRFNVGEEELRKLFEPFGAITSVKVILDKVTGRSRGFGFVEMGTEAEANGAIEALNGLDMGGRAISVAVARERENRPSTRSW